MGLAERSKKTVMDTMGWEGEEEEGMKKESKSRNQNKYKDGKPRRAQSNVSDLLRPEHRMVIAR